MIANLGVFWLIMAMGTVAILSFILSLALDAIIGQDGVGGVGGMILMTGGFFGGLYGLNHFGMRFRDIQDGAVAGMACALAAFAVILLGKAVVRRI
ncbi:hypothetical protein [Mesorhizobium xinjiangense]|uniref:hypothetical protein n=1 Tax=Mesorhizobium xinjiangense TaxID=2678685 RepID=UPI0012ED2188|nr:hypothetical protein [Mesorhizobium xinjiangense]